MNESSWDVEAIRRFPDLVERFGGATSVYALWDELIDAFKTAYRPPLDEDLIRRIYEYARWCFDQPSAVSTEEDLGTCVTVCFLEEIPTCEAALADMPRWFTRAGVEASRTEFSRLVGEEGYKRILETFDRT